MISPAQSRAESLLSAQKRMLEAIANRVSLFEVLDDLCRTIDANASGVISSVALMDPDGKRLWLGAGPQFPTKLKQAAFPWPWQGRLWHSGISKTTGNHLGHNNRSEVAG